MSELIFDLLCILYHLFVALTLFLCIGVKCAAIYTVTWKSSV